MSVEAISWALRRQDVRGTDKLVLIGIANHADPHGGNAWPAVATLAQYASVDKRNVQRAIARLEDAGVGVVERNAGGNHDTAPDRRPNRYRLAMGGVAPAPPRDETPPPDRGDGSATPRDGAPATPRGGACVATGVAHAPPEPSLNHPSTSSSSTTSPAPSSTVDDDDRIRVALEVLADRRTAAGAATNPNAYRARCLTNFAAEGVVDEAKRRLAAYPDLTAAQLADVLAGNTTVLATARRAEADR